MKKIKRFSAALLVIGLCMSSLLISPIEALANTQDTAKLVNLYESVGTVIYYHDYYDIKTEKVKKVSKQKKNKFKKKGKVKINFPVGEYSSRDSVNLNGTIYHTDTYKVVMSQKGTLYKKRSKKAKKVVVNYVQEVKIRHPEGIAFKVVNDGGRLYLRSGNPYNIYNQAMFTYYHKSEVKDVSPELLKDFVDNGISTPLTFGVNDIPVLMDKKGQKTIECYGDSNVRGALSYSYHNKKTVKRLYKYFTDMSKVSAESKSVWKGTQEYAGGMK